MLAIERNRDYERHTIARARAPSAPEIDEPEPVALRGDRVAQRDRLEIIRSARSLGLADEAIEQIGLHALDVGIVGFDQEERRGQLGEQRRER